jgi:hypothetical protein
MARPRRNDNFITAEKILITPAMVGQSRVRTIPDLEMSDLEYDSLFGKASILFVDPDEMLPDSRLLPHSEFIGTTVFGEFAETFELNGNPEYAAKKVITFEDLKIRNDKKQLITFAPNQVQQNYLDVIIPDWRAKIRAKTPLQPKGLREIILKPRKLGFSTLILALFLEDTINNPQTHTIIIAHDQQTTERLFQELRKMYRNLPDEKRPRTEYNSKRELSFPDIDSYIYVGTAGSGNYGRGGTPNNIHCSEVAFWRDPDSIAAGLFESVPREGNIFLETTANGYGWLSDEYFAAKKTGTDKTSRYTSRFFPWTIKKDNREEVPPDFVKTEDEIALAEAFGLDDEQVYWRRGKKSTLKGQFEQEHPLTDVEAFVVSGNPYFDRIALNILYQTLITNPEDFDSLPPNKTGLKGRDYPELARELVRGKLRIWEPPLPGIQYVIGADVAEGAEINEDKDNDAASIVRADTMEEVGVLVGQWSPADYAILLSQAGYWYNLALLAPERNNHGHSVLNTLQNGRPGYEQWIYPIRRPGFGGLYYEEPLQERQTFAGRIKKAKAQLLRKPGWNTDKASKPMMLDFLDDMINEEKVGINSADTVSELMKYVKKGGQKSGGEGNSHDDRVIALAIAVFLTQTMERFNSAAGINSGIVQSGGNNAAGGLGGLFSGGKR